MPIVLQSVPSHQLEDSVRVRFLELHTLVSQYSTGEDKASSGGVLGAIAQLSMANVPLANWDEKAAADLLLLLARIGRKVALQALSDGDVALVEQIDSLAHWLCNLAAAMPQAGIAPRLQACGLTTMMYLSRELPDEEPEAFLEQSAAHFAEVFKLDPGEVPDLQGQIQLQAVLAVGRAYDKNIANEVWLHAATGWCVSLLRQGLYVPLLQRVSKALGVDVPDVVVVVPPGEIQAKGDVLTPPVEDPASLNGPRFWPSPPVMPVDGLQDEYQQVLSSVMMCSFTPSHPLAPRTVEQVRQLDLSSTPDAYGTPFFYAIRQLWRGYWTTGNDEHLQLAGRLAAFLYNVEVANSEGGLQDVQRRRRLVNSLTNWMTVQLPLLIQTSDPISILTDASRLCRSLGVDMREQHIREGIIQAFAGICRQLEQQNDSSARMDLLASNRASLWEMHQDYLRFSQMARHDPSRDEGTAWAYLVPDLGPAPESSVESENHSGNRSDGVLPAVAGSLLDDPRLREALQRGSPQRVFDFIAERESEIRSRLIERLDVRLSTDYLMTPDGAVFNSQGQNRRQLHPDFVESKRLIDSGEWRRAIAYLERLAGAVSGRPREFCHNFTAYALAKDGNLLRARRILTELSDNKFPYPSTYWNLACCTQDDTAQQLEFLVLGIERAPHPQLLHGAVCIGLLLEDDRVRKWLLWMPFIEALLLTYLLEFENMTVEDRDKALFRLDFYLEHGEPVAPSPTADRVFHADATNFLNDLVRREQYEAGVFWLNCRERVARRDRFDHLVWRTDFLERIQRRKDAAESFNEELRRRLATFIKPLDINRTINSEQIIRRRSEEWLARCMTNELTDIGRDIYLQLKMANLDALMPRNRQLRDHYESGTGPIATPRNSGNGSVDQGANRQLGQSTPGQHEHSGAREPLEVTLARVGGECMTQLHEVDHVARVKPVLSALEQALRDHDRHRSMTALQNLVAAWQTHSRTAPADERQAILAKSQRAFSVFTDALDQELSSQERATATQLLAAMARVNERSARSLGLLPVVSVEVPLGDQIEVDPSDEISAIPVRVRYKEGRGSDPLRITSAIAFLSVNEVETELRLRDRLSELPVNIVPGGSSVISFEKPRGLSITSNGSIGVTIVYEYNNTTVDTGRTILSVTPQPCSDLPDSSPYVYARPLEPEEIEDHFFGRDDEQTRLLAGILPGENRLHYVEGIRRTGKSSLLKSLVYEIEKRSLPLIPVYLLPATGVEHGGIILSNFFQSIAAHPAIADIGLELPSEERCCANMQSAYMQFISELQARLPGRRILAMVDDFQEFVLSGSEEREADARYSTSLIALANLIRAHSSPTSPIAWIFAGHRAQRQFRTLLPGALLWADLRPVRTDFLSEDAIADIVTKPMEGSNVIILPETVARMFWLTKGYPETVQQIAEFMFLRAKGERRAVLTPSDADDAAWDIAKHTDTFAETWYPVAELSREQRAMIAAYVHAVPVGERIEINRLVNGQHLSETQQAAVDDLQARRIVDFVDGYLSIRAPVLDVWLHEFVPGMVIDSFNGAVAVFVDVANLTDRGSGSAIVRGLGTMAGEDGVAGQFQVKTILEYLDRYAQTFSPVPIAVKKTVNFPPGSPAVVACLAAGYGAEPIPQELMQKGEDDTILYRKMWEVAEQYTSVNHFVLALGDRDYKVVAIEKLLQDGKYVHLVSLEKKLSQAYRYLESQYPERFSVKTFESLLDENRPPVSM